MKKVILAVIAITAISCTKEVCVTCIDTNDRWDTQYFCGEPSDAKDFEKELKDRQLNGQAEPNWACNKQKFK